MTSRSAAAWACGLGLALASGAWGQGALDELAGAARLDAAALHERIEAQNKVFDHPRLFEFKQSAPKVEGPRRASKEAEASSYSLLIRGEQFEKPYLFQATLVKGTGEKGVFSAQMLDTFACLFRRSGDKVEFVRVNTGYRAEPGTPGERAVKRSFGDSVLATLPVLSTGPAEGDVAVDPAAIFLKDPTDAGAMVRGAYRGASGDVAEDESAIESFQAAPDEILVQVHLIFKKEDASGSQTLPDARKISLVLRYSVSELPGTGYEPRPADPRVGFFTTTFQDWSNPTAKTPYVQLINRWRLEKKDPDAAVSDVKEPIVFWMENTIPLEFREAVKQGILGWNEAFEAIGLKNALVVKQQPDEPGKGSDFDPAAAETRYNMVRWFVGDKADFAIGPSRVNPFTGEIYNATVSISGWMARYFNHDFDMLSAARPAGGSSKSEGGYNARLAEQARFGLSALEARGELTPELKQRYLDEYLTHLVLHEIGHNLGLRHNFKASTYKNLEDMSEGDIAGSVMDYMGVNIAPEGVKQGHFFQVRPGPYDHWAVEYGYKVLQAGAQAQKSELAKIASRSTQPGLDYGTDEDMDGSDPYAQVFDMGKDPLADNANRVRLASKVLDRLRAGPSAASEDSPSRDWNSFRGALSEYRMAADNAASFIGGISRSRAGAKDASAGPAFTAVPAAKQRAALAFLGKNIFSDAPFRFPPEMLQRLAFVPETEGAPSAAPAADMVANMRAAALAEIYSPATLRRLLQSESLSRSPMRLSEVFDTVRGSVWSELRSGAPVPPMRRELQRRHLAALAAVASQGGLPAEAAAKAREDLRAVVRDAQKALKSKKLDAATRSHLGLVLHDAKSALQDHGSRGGSSDEEDDD